MYDPTASPILERADMAAPLLSTPAQIAVQVEILQPLQVAARLPADAEVPAAQEQGASAGAASRSAPPGAPLANGGDGKEDIARERTNKGDGAQLPSEGGSPAPSAGREEDHPVQVASASAAMSAGGPRDADRPSSSYGASTSADGRHQYVTAFAVEFLPPLRLTCVLPPSYPSRAPPSFRLSCQWLGERHLAALCGEMDALWAQQAGQVVVYQWADHLSRCLQSLGLAEQLELGPYGPSRAGGRRAAGEGAGGALPPPRAASESVSLEEDVMQLRRFDEEQRAAAFRGGIHTCAICFTQQPGQQRSRPWSAARLAVPQCAELRGGLSWHICPGLWSEWCVPNHLCSIQGAGLSISSSCISVTAFMRRRVYLGLRCVAMGGRASRV